MWDQTRRSNQTGDAMIHPVVMKPESKLSGFIDRRQTMAGISIQDTAQCFLVQFGTEGAGLPPYCVSHRPVAGTISGRAFN
jgi:hypothetical protein